VKRAIESELLKLRTTRTFIALVASSTLLVGVITGLVAALVKFDDSGTPPGEDLVGIASFATLFALVLGLLAVTTELRHGTITPTLLAVPSRARVIAAKLVAYLLAGLVLGLATVALEMALAEGIFALRDIDSGTSLSEAARWIGGIGAATALYAALGVAVGAIVRHQVAALVGGLAWLFVVESLLPLIPGTESAIQKFSLGGLSDGVDGYVSDAGAHPLAQLPAGLVLAGYIAVLALIGAALLRRRDVSA
jgi:ABC-2 type transport system permease protein